MHLVAVAIEAYSIDAGRYPKASRGVVSDVRRLVEPTYIWRLPTKDAWGGDYLLEVSQDGTEYRLTSLGSDGKESGPRAGVLGGEADDLIAATGRLETWPTEFAQRRNLLDLSGWPHVSWAWEMS